MNDTAMDHGDYAGRVEQEMARRLDLIGAASDSALLRSRFGEYSQLRSPVPSEEGLRRRRRRRTDKRMFHAVLRGLLVAAFAIPTVLAASGFGTWIWAVGLIAVLCLNELVHACSWPKGALRARRGRRVVLVGAGEQAADFMKLWDPASAGISVVGACEPVTTGTESATWWGELRIGVLGTVDDLREVVTAGGADTVIVIPHSGLSRSALHQMVWSLEDTDAELFLSQSIVDLGTSRQATVSVAGLTLIKVSRHMRQGIQYRLRAFADRVLAAALLLLSLPLVLFISVLIWITDPGPALFRQTRVGRDGEQFIMYKFRTMKVEAARFEAELSQLNYSGDGLLFKMRRDPRITPVGRVLRRYSLDELPQLINVLIGDMSLVGPRPPLPEEAAAYGPDLRRRLLVKPGLTGLWQISGRSDLSWEDSVRLDLAYVDNWSIRLDLAIMFRTISAVLRGTGAY
ncbi:sugar transferase [Streptomyces sp. NPDC050504]|uniref:sugar transferase n=1 Tax=Streptomyces sp. NPDC050504 TaxID=3365618 RepID=UPI0037B2CF78